MHVRLSRITQFRRETKLLLLASGVLAISFFGIQMLLKVLYVLRLGYGLEFVGLFNATGALTYMAMSLPAGAAASRFGIQRTMIIGCVVTVFGMAMLPMTEVLPASAWDGWLILSQVILTVGYALFGISAVPALMAASSPENRNDAFAMSGVLRGLGTFVGTLFGGLLPGLFALAFGLGLDDPSPYRYALWISALLGMVALPPLLKVGRLESTEPGEATSAGGTFPMLPVALVAGYVALSHGGGATCQSLCSAYMDTDLKMSVAAIGLVTAIGQFVAMMAPMVGPHLARQRGNGWILVVTALGVGLFLAPLALVPTGTAASIGRVGVLALSALQLPALQIFQMELVAVQWRSMAYGAASMAMGLGFGVMSLAGGYIAALWGYSWLFMIGVGLSVASAVLLHAGLRVPALRVKPPAPIHVSPTPSELT